MEELVDINLIDVNDETFRISRRIEDGNLSDSILNYGMLEKPFLLKNSDRYIPFSCHNRIKICAESGINKISVIILDKPDPGRFFNNLVLKLHRNEVGPVGKLRAVNILESISPSFIKENLVKFRKIAGIPGEYFLERSAGNRVLSLPAELLNYLDSRDVNFKVIKDITAMDIETQKLLDKWVKLLQIRVNIFKKIADHVFDIERRDGVESLKMLDADSLKDDTALYMEIFKIRYPDYSRINNISTQLIDKIKVPGLSVDFPEFLERDYITLKLNVSKRDGAGEWRKILSGLSDKNIKELLDLL